MSSTIRLRRPAAACLLALACSTAAARASVGLPGEGPMRHIQALQEIAQANGGNRASGTAGYDRSAEYVAEQLRQAGYAVRFEEFTFAFSEERAPPVLAVMGAAPAETPRGELSSLSNSGSGDVAARLHAVDLGLGAEPLATSTSGCEAEDFAGFERGRIALLRRGTCPFQQKVDNAVAAGAAGAIIMNQGTGGDTGLFGGRLNARAAIPVLGVTTETGRRLAAAAAAPEGAMVRLAVTIESGTRATRNVIAERPGTAPGLAVVGAHLDSVTQGPGINDNASGTAAVLDTALRMAAEPPGETAIRFGFWGAEERGLIGSRHHVNALSEEERRRIGIYINLDMVGSPNFGRFVQTTGETLGPEIGRRFAAHFRERGLAVDERKAGQRRGYGTDDASFAEKGIPTVGLFTGAGESKGEPQAGQFGGTAGRPYDPCYHQACDTPANVSPVVLGEMTEALQAVLRGVASTPLRRAEP
ncbi:MAG TPA: M28 family peptidase [Microvirga sp.]|jgi:aminopeptidase Y|nr:M28 family peptidase [Microvirga sp.]